MLFEDYDTEFGYSFSDLRRGYSRKAYAVPDYDVHSLEEIELCLASHKYSERRECVEHLKCLEDLQKRLSMIAMAEEREGVMNWELREVLEKIRVMARRVVEVMERMPEIIMYKTSKGNETRPSGQERRGTGETGAKTTHSEPLM